MLFYKDFHKDFSTIPITRFKVNPILEALNIYCFDYQGFKSEYKKFTSKGKLVRPKYNDIRHDNLCFYVMNDKEIEDEHRSSHAMQYGIVNFCIALELRCMMHRIEFRDDPLTHYEEKHTRRIIDFASRFYKSDFILYINSYYMYFDNPSVDFFNYVYNPPLDSFLEYIKDCFMNRKKPSYISYLDFSSRFYFQEENKKEIQNNFLELIEIENSGLRKYYLR